MPLCSRVPVLRFVMAATSLLSASALAATLPSRIAKVGTTADTPLAHSVSARAKQAMDLGPAPTDQRLNAITLHFSRSAAQQAALNQLLTDQQTPGSPRYHKWLTPLQFKAQFGMSDADVAKTSAWLTAQGLTVTTKALTNTYIVAQGSVGQAEKAFSVSMRSVRLSGQLHVVNVTDPQLPAALANVVTGITGLSDVLPRPRAVLRKVAKAEFTTGTSHYITPADYSTIYDLAPLKAAAINGTGATIAVMGQTTISLSDVAAFRAAAGLTANVPVVSYEQGLVASDDDLPEAQLDVEWAGAVAPNATIQYVGTSAGDGGAFQSLLSAIGNTTGQTLAPILSISYGECEPNLGQAQAYAYDQSFQQANAQGQTIIGPGGDSGATDCDFNAPPAADGLAVDFPGSSPHATSIGGTMFNDAGGNYWGTSNGAGGGSALSYIPETVWNETSSQGLLAAGGGGRSVFYTKPSWQIGTGVPADSVRDTPDIALDAGVDNDGLLICVSGSIAACTSGFADASGNYYVVGGTSAGAPSFAGILALVQQKTGQTLGLGNINPTLYGLAATSAASVYHDVTSGSNASTCAVGSPDCPTTTLLAGYSAGVGYDLASGWGSIDGSNLVNQWASAFPTPDTVSTGSSISNTTMSLSSGTASCGINSGSTTFNVSVATGASGVTATPTGTVQLFVDGTLVAGASAPLSNGAAGLTLNTSTLPSGGHTIAAAYSGDTTYASSRGDLSSTLSPAPTSIYVPSTIDVVSTTAPDFALTPCLPTLVVASGGSGTVTITATAFNGFSGPVTFSASSDRYLAAGYGFSAPSVTLSAGAAGTSVFTLNAYYSATGNLRKASQSMKKGGLEGMSRRQLYGTGAGTAALASMLFLVLPRRRRYVGLLAIVLSVAAFGAAGCGSGATSIPSTVVPPSTGKTNTPTGYYIINVTATGTNSAGTPLAHTASLTLQVQ